MAVVKLCFMHEFQKRKTKFIVLNKLKHLWNLKIFLNHKIKQVFFFKVLLKFLYVIKKKKNSAMYVPS